MGRQDVDRRSDGERDTAFTRALLNDLRALERMHEQGLIERGVRRIGAEQELVLVDRHWAPCPLGPEILARITDPRVTTELALFNLECNLDPLTLGGACLARMEAGLRQVLGVVQQAAAEFEATVVLTGILPTLALSDLSSQNITPRPRYFAIDEAVRRIRGGPYELRIKGADDLSVTNESIMLEALNTSFQVHYQVSDQEFPALFNIAQAIAAPTLAAAANSPILFGKRLWHETRIAIFQQVVETRSNRTPGREGLARVRFGEFFECRHDTIRELHVRLGATRSVGIGIVEVARNRAGMRRLELFVTAMAEAAARTGIRTGAENVVALVDRSLQAAD